MNTLVLVRGLPGSGKTTFVANMMVENSVEFSADDFMYADGQEFDPARLAECHKEVPGCCSYSSGREFQRNGFRSQHVYPNVGDGTVL